MEVLRTYGKTATIYFPLVDFGATDYESTPVTFATGDVTYSIDGAAFSNTSNNPAHEGGGIYSLAITAAETLGGIIVFKIVDQTDPKTWEDQCVIVNTNLSGWVEGNQSIIIGEVDSATFTPTTTEFEGFRISPNATEEATADHYNGRLITFTSGALLGQQTTISDYSLANSKEKFVVTALTEAPGDGDNYIIT